MVKSSAGNFPVSARLISVSKGGWGKNPPRSPSELAPRLLGKEFEYTFTGRIRHLNRLTNGRVLVFRFMKTVVGEAQFDCWIKRDTMLCRTGRPYSNMLPSREYIPRSANPYRWLSKEVLSGIRKDANKYVGGSYVKTDEQESPTTHRVGQGDVRTSALLRYGGKCALCRVDAPPLLVAGHIRGWAKGKKSRGSPDNVILLCSMHDTLFGKGYITLNYPSYDVEYCRKALSASALKQLKSITFEFAEPMSGAPGKKFLKWHSINVFGRPIRDGYSF